MTWLEELVEERTKALREEVWEMDEPIAHKFVLETIKLLGRGIIENIVKESV